MFTQRGLISPPRHLAIMREEDRKLFPLVTVGSVVQLFRWVSAPVTLTLAGTGMNIGYIHIYNSNHFTMIE